MRRPLGIRFALALLVPSAAFGQQIVRSIDPAHYLFPIIGQFPGDISLGEEFTALADPLTRLDEFSFLMGPSHTGNTLFLRAMVYAWNGTTVDGPALFLSDPTTILDSDLLTTYTFHTGGLDLAPGHAYVAFLNSTSYVEAGGSQYAEMVIGNNGSTDGGDVAARGDPDDPKTVWEADAGSGYHAAFTATFSDVTPTPEPGTLLLSASGMILFVGALRRRRARVALSIISLSLLPALVQAQTSAGPSLSDAAIISREQSVWDALAKRDSSGAIAILGENVPFTVFGSNGPGQTTTAALVGNITSRCTTTRNQLDSVHVVHPTPLTDIVTYTVALERTCGANPATLVIYRVESVWGDRGGRRVAMSQILIPKK